MEEQHLLNRFLDRFYSIPAHWVLRHKRKVIISALVLMAVISIKIREIGLSLNIPYIIISTYCIILFIC